NEKLNLLDSVTRHDLLNQLTAFQGFTGLAEESSADPAVTAYLGRARAVATKMQALLKFTRDYQNMGMREPQWQSVREVFLQAAPSLETPEIALSVDVGELSIYADPLLEKVFANLMDNAFRHGGHVSKIHLYYEEHPDAIVLIFEDNGAGVSAIEKELIFRRGYGKNTGYGLFLCREILALTGMSILETGEPGRGARFEIAVPRVNCRLHAKRGETSRDEVVGS
ncbi:MAG: sensor histidine kinase, partial [Methanobacteriota archaeon]